MNGFAKKIIWLEGAFNAIKHFRNPSFVYTWTVDTWVGMSMHTIAGRNLKGKFFMKLCVELIQHRLGRIQINESFVKIFYVPLIFHQSQLVLYLISDFWFSILNFSFFIRRVKRRLKKFWLVEYKMEQKKWYIKFVFA